MRLPRLHFYLPSLCSPSPHAHPSFRFLSSFLWSRSKGSGLLPSWRGGRPASIDPRPSTPPGSTPLIQGWLVRKGTPLSASRRSRAQQMQPVVSKVEPLPPVGARNGNCGSNSTQTAAARVWPKLLCVTERPHQRANTVRWLKQSPQSFISSSLETRCHLCSRTSPPTLSAEPCTLCTPRTRAQSCCRLFYFSA